MIHGHNIQLTFLFLLHYAINFERNLPCICKILWNVLWIYHVWNMSYKCMPFILKRIILYFYIEICISCVRPYFSFKLLLSGNNNIHLTYVLGIKRGWIYTMLLIAMTTAKTCHINCQKWMQRTFVYKLYSIIQLLKHDNKNQNLSIFE